jgi:5-methylcytosine-specific restriction endonuclease McrA
MSDQTIGNYCGRCRRTRTGCICAKQAHAEARPASKETMEKLGISRFKVVKKKIDREAIHAKFGGKCAYCGEAIELKEMQVDHVIPQSDLVHNILKDEFKRKETIPHFLRHLLPSDMNHPDNLFPTCKVCNNWKSWHSLEDFRMEISLQVSRLRRDSAAFRMAERYDLINETGHDIEFWFEKMDKYNFLLDHA